MDQDILDESYRKARKMNLAKFAARLDVVASGLVDAISPDILQGQTTDGNKGLRAELYKLDVYDTPRGDTMIGSLVVIFPTAHTGGALTLEHAGATLAYVAFYSDVTHAVEPVKTGHRVTLTYNLFLFDNDAHTAAVRVVPAPERALEAALCRLLANPSFRPSGGYLAYKLLHQYPMPPPLEGEWDPAIRGRRMPPSRLGPVLRLLRGSDARVRTVSERVGLATHVKILYDSGANFTKGAAIEGMGVILQRGEQRTQELEEKAGRAGEGWDYNEDRGEEEEKPLRDAVEVHWVTKITELNRVSSTYVAYGNDASLQHVYGNTAPFVHVPAFGEGIRA
ncbi:hypothetical protein DFH08DRAFT_961945 [Mycena albidolilacea]|uniref:Prolyl 4-hydroxylase alpha subunit Fe(2+) 2OG dioxygenase domain-containing protein n=1 Tax=Mycena albidolilacea TaxID=1033008 RepID=A0AAD6ZYY0_9AGAR|nr:hypothetical protein DFH08DRAFT_961945 [Mycena albidolilacea]